MMLIHTTLGNSFLFDIGINFKLNCSPVNKLSNRDCISQNVNVMIISGCDGAGSIDVDFFVVVGGVTGRSIQCNYNQLQILIYL